MRGNIISFQVFFDSKGNLMTELSAFPENEIKNIFTDTYMQAYVKTILRECHLKLDDLHNLLESNIQALN
tara:strand:+ start:117 stop:326 length:210 start_codon:yes stop_codon:yes gene_type:complete